MAGSRGKKGGKAGFENPYCGSSVICNDIIRRSIRIFNGPQPLRFPLPHKGGCLSFACKAESTFRLGRTEDFELDVGSVYSFQMCLRDILFFILLHDKFLQFDWRRAEVFQLNMKYLHVKITNLLWEVVYRKCSN